MEDYFFHPTRPPDGGLGPCASQPTHPSLSSRNRCSIFRSLPPSAPQIRPGGDRGRAPSSSCRCRDTTEANLEDCRRCVSRHPFPLSPPTHSPTQSRERCKIEARSLRAWCAEGWPSSTFEGEYDARGRSGAGHAMDYTKEVLSDAGPRVSVFG